MSTAAMTEYTMRVTTSAPHAEALARVCEALERQGFGVLTRIDVRETLRSKLGVDGPEQVILGVCRPQLAHQAIAVSPSVAALLPCSVVVRASGEGTVVEALDPEVLRLLEDRPAIIAVAAEARTRLRAALDDLVSQEA